MQRNILKTRLRIHQECFEQCIDDFTEGKLTQTEIDCVNKCVKQESDNASLIIHAMRVNEERLAIDKMVAEDAARKN